MDIWQYTTSRSPLSQLSKPLMAIRSSGGFSHLWPGVFHISLQTHNPQHTQLRGWKKRRTNNHGLGLAPSARREKSVTLSLHSVLLWANASMYLSEIPTKSQRNAGSSSHIGQHGICWSTGPSSCLSDFCWLPCSLDWSVLSTSLDWLLLCSADSETFLPLSSSGLVGNLRCKPFVWGFTPKQTKGSSDWHPHLHASYHR